MKQNELSNDEIQDLADTLIEKMITSFLKSINLKPLKNTPKKEKGIDFIIEAQERTSLATTKFTFNIQNKGKNDTLKQNLDGLISLKIEKFRQLEYFCEELPTALIITYCDVVNENVFWDPIQLKWGKYQKQIKEIKNKLKTRERKTSSIQVYFDPNNIIVKNGRLVKKNVEKIYKDIITSNDTISARHIFGQRLSDLTAVIPSNSLNDVIKSLTELDAVIEIIRAFNGINYIPKHILLKLYPFSKDDNSIARYSNGTLYTYNSELIELFSKYSKFENNFYFKSGKKLDSAESKKLSQVLKFLRRQGINRIESTPFFSKSVEFYHLYTYPRANSIKSKIDTLDYSTGYLRSEELQENDNILKSYGLSKLGLFVKANNAIEKSLERSEMDRQYVVIILNQYRQSKLKWALKNRYFRNGLEEKIQELDRINPIQNLYSFRSKLYEEVFSTLLYIINEDFFHEALYFSQQYLSDLREIHFKDQLGSWTRNDKFNSLYSTVALLDELTEGNYIDISNSLEYSLLVESLLEGFIINYGIQNVNSSRSTEMNSLLLLFFINNVEVKKMQKLLNYYVVHEIKYNPKSNEIVFSKFVENLSKSILILEQVMNENEFMESNYYLVHKFNQILQNIAAFSRYLTLSPKDLNKVIKHINTIVFNTVNLHHTSVEMIESLFLDKRDQIESKYIIAIDKFISKTKRFDLFHDFDRLSLFGKPELKKRFNKRFTSLIYYYQSDETKQSPDRLLDYYKLGTIDQRRKIVKLIYNYLNNEFNHYLFVRATLGELITYDEFEDKFIEDIKKNNSANNKNITIGIMGRYINYHILHLIEICYKFSINMNKYKYLFDNSDYIAWLTNLSEFDYEKFDPYWILEYNSINYYTQFKKHSLIIAKVKEYLNRKPNLELFYIYNNYLT